MWRDWLRLAQERATELKILCAFARCKKTVIANPVKSKWENVQQEAADELKDAEGHDFFSVVVCVVRPTESNLAVVDRDDPLIRDRDAVRVACKILQDHRRVCERRPSLDGPLVLAGFDQESFEGLGLGEALEFTFEREFALLESALEIVEKLGTKNNLEDSDRQEESFWSGNPPGFVEGKAAARDDEMYMRVSCEAQRYVELFVSVTPISVPCNALR